MKKLTHSALYPHDRQLDIDKQRSQPHHCGSIRWSLIDTPWPSRPCHFHASPTVKLALCTGLIDRGGQSTLHHLASVRLKLLDVLQLLAEWSFDRVCSEARTHRVVRNGADRPHSASYGCCLFTWRPGAGLCPSFPFPVAKGFLSGYFHFFPFYNRRAPRG